MMRLTPIRLEGVRGVGTVELDLQPEQRVYTLIGVNAIGKTKTLEALFQCLLFNNRELPSYISKGIVNPEALVFNRASLGEFHLQVPKRSSFIESLHSQPSEGFHQLPVVFLASQNRGYIKPGNSTPKLLGSLEQRRQAYFQRIFKGMENNFTSLNMDVGIEEWFVMLGQSANRYQKKEDSREIEIETVLSLLHKLDERIDAEFLEISGDGRVSLRVDGEKRELSQLSTGFASILKIIQGIVSGYGIYTNESRLQLVRGIVLVDEIESHLHLRWQARIIPLLKSLFPNTTFIITTHSSIVISQLQEGEAYRLYRDKDGTVRNSLIKAPDKSAFVDVLKDAFDIDLNKMKRERMSAERQKEAKAQLLSLIQDEGVSE